MVEESYFDDLDRDLLNISSKMSSFFEWTYGMLGYRLIAPLEPNKFDHATSLTKEIGIRTLIVVGAIAAFCLAGSYLALVGLVLGAGSKVFRGAGFYFQKDGFTYVKGRAWESYLKDGKASVMTWNIRGFGGGLHYDHGGVVHWSDRIDRIVEKIRGENPDVLILQEVYDTALVEALIEKLGDQFAHFYTHLGSNTFGDESGCMVMTKCAVEHFTHTEFSNNDDKVNRGFETIEIKASPSDTQPCARIIGTQLTPDKQAQAKRAEQVDQIVASITKEKRALPTLFVGSFHMSPDEEILSNYLHHSYREREATYSPELVSQWTKLYEGEDESSDFISFFKRNLPGGKTLPVIEKGISLLDAHLVEGFVDCDTTSALSDHHGVVTTFSGIKGR